MTTFDSELPILEDVLGASPGQAFAIRASNEFGDRILSGTVDDVLTTDPTVDIKALQHDVDDLGLPGGPLRTAVLALDAQRWWGLPSDGDDGEARRAVDHSDRLQDRPPAKPYRYVLSREPPRCSISYATDGRLGLSIPGPVAGGGRIKGYAPTEVGRVTGFVAGDVVDPRLFLQPDGRPPQRLPVLAIRNRASRYDGRGQCPAKD